jgi:hypothetical protein
MCTAASHTNWGCRGVVRHDTLRWNAVIPVQGQKTAGPSAPAAVAAAGFGSAALPPVFVASPARSPWRASAGRCDAEAVHAVVPRRRPPARASASACRWAMASPIAKVVWCRSSVRLNSTGSRSAALHRRLARRRHHLGQAFVVVRQQLLDARVQAGEGPAVRRQHQRVGRQVRMRRSTPGTAAAGCLGLGSITLTLVEMRGSTMSPEISTPSSGAVQAHVLRRVAVAHDAGPVPPPMRSTCHPSAGGSCAAPRHHAGVVVARAARTLASASGSVSPWLAKKRAAASPPKPVVLAGHACAVPVGCR